MHTGKGWFRGGRGQSPLRSCSLFCKPGYFLSKHSKVLAVISCSCCFNAGIKLQKVYLIRNVINKGKNTNQSNNKKNNWIYIRQELFFYYVIIYWLIEKPVIVN